MMKSYLPTIAPKANQMAIFGPRFTSQRNCYGFIRSVYRFYCRYFLLFYSVVCYVPIDSNYPDARLNLIIEDAAKIHIIITLITLLKVITFFIYCWYWKEIGSFAKESFKHKSTSWSSSLHHLHWDLQETKACLSTLQCY
jgi:hypothetical protein